MIRRPFRSPRATTRPDTLTAAMADLEETRSVVRALRILVSQQKEGASALHAAEYRLNGALRRVERLGGLRRAEGSEPPLDAA